MHKLTPVYLDIWSEGTCAANSQWCAELSPNFVLIK